MAGAGEGSNPLLAGGLPLSIAMGRGPGGGASPDPTWQDEDSDDDVRDAFVDDGSVVYEPMPDDWPD